MRMLLLVAIGLAGCGVDSKSKGDRSPSGQCIEGQERCSDVDLVVCDAHGQWILLDCDDTCSAADLGVHGRCDADDATGGFLCLCSDEPPESDAPGSGQSDPSGDECSDGETFCRGSRLNRCYDGYWEDFRCNDASCREAGFIKLGECGINPGATEHACLCVGGPWENARDCMVDHCFDALLGCGLTCTEYTACYVGCYVEETDDDFSACVDDCNRQWLNGAAEAQIQAIVDCGAAAGCVW